MFNLILFIIFGGLGLAFMIGGIQTIRANESDGGKMFATGLVIFIISVGLYSLSFLPEDKPSLTDYHTWCYDNGYESDDSDYYDAIGE